MWLSALQTMPRANQTRPSSAALTGMNTTVTKSTALSSHTAVAAQARLEKEHTGEEINEYEAYSVSV